jgi:hypothetical protein
MKRKQKISAGRMMKATATNEQRLFPGAMVRGVGLPQVLQDDVHSLQDIASRARILGGSPGWEA